MLPSANEHTALKRSPSAETFIFTSNNILCHLLLPIHCLREDRWETRDSTCVEEDDKDLTILIPLSDPSTDFTGGGTAFWAERHPQDGMHDPSLILRPRAGTGILFGGRVSHKGMHIHSGTRVVFVISFSRLRKEEKEE